VEGKTDEPTTLDPPTGIVADQHPTALLRPSIPLDQGGTVPGIKQTAGEEIDLSLRTPATRPRPGVPCRLGGVKHVLGQDGRVVVGDRVALGTTGLVTADVRLVLPDDGSAPENVEDSRSGPRSPSAEGRDLGLVQPLQNNLNTVALDGPGEDVPDHLGPVLDD